jgi:RHS repeat-associated protein
MQENDDQAANNGREQSSAAKTFYSGSAASKSIALEIPQITLPKGGGAIKGIDEKFSVNASNGSASAGIPLPLTPAKGAPSLSLAYNSGSGNSVFGLGWSASLPAIQRKTDKQLPRYADNDESDVFQIAGAEDLVPALKPNGDPDELTVDGFFVKRYRPRIEGGFSRIEQVHPPGGNPFYWKVTDSSNNVTIFGSTTNARIADPENPAHVFTWLPELAFDDKGSVACYSYKAEAGDGAAAASYDLNRYDSQGAARFTNRYLKRIRYGNRTPFYPAYMDDPQDTVSFYKPVLPAGLDFYFEAVFDYGEHGNELAPGSFSGTVHYGEQQAWPSRSDAFSDYRAGFEIRTMRLCRRVLMFHHFDELGAIPCLVRSLDISYSDSQAGTTVEAEVTYLVQTAVRGYTRDTGETYFHKALPPVKYDYIPLAWDKSIQSIDADALQNLPEGTGGNYQWVDLFGEGISSVLSEHGNALYYHTNLGDGNFTAGKAIAQKPSFTGLNGNGLSLQDLDADGTKQIVSHTQHAAGYFDLDVQQQWQRFVPFRQLANVAPAAPNVLQLDLDGDGRADLLVTEDTVTRWYHSEGRAGYGEPETIAKADDEEKGPQLIWNDTVQRIFLADMSGDGLSDIVRIRNGEVCYWPNLGYGSFGNKIAMSNPPRFAHADVFDPRYLHLADLTGTGASDVIYLDGKSAAVWLNCSGNRWSGPEIIPMPDTVLPNRFSTADLLGNGTTCIVWSSPLPGNAHAPLRYIDLSGGKKPHLLLRTSNGMGKETTLTYKSSTHFYLEDKRAGRPWKTKLPFPVHCLWKTEVRELVTNTVLVNEYSYHHGYYDHAEREFRGFGRVDQKDTETFSNWKRQDATNLLDEKFHQPVVLTRTWFYTGALTDGKDIFDFFEDDYWYKNPELTALLGSAPAGEEKLPPVKFPDALTPAEYREAHRACKGMTLRQEVFSLDAPEQGATVAERVKELTPYSVGMHNCIVQRRQPRGENRHGIFLVHESEALTINYERAPGDPRISHTLNLEIDGYGHVLRSAAVVYGRQLAAAPAGTPPEVWTEQQKMHIVLAENVYTDDDFTAGGAVYRLPAVCETKSYELTGLVLAVGEKIFHIADVTSAWTAAIETGYEFVAPADQQLRKRLTEHNRILFLSVDLSTPEKFKKGSALGMVAQTYQLAFTEPVFRAIISQAQIPDADIPTILGTEGKYVHFDDQHDTFDGHWWIRSGTINYLDLTTTRLRYFLPSSYTDPWGAITTVFYAKEDATRCNPETHWGIIQRTVNPVGHESQVLDFNYRTLAPLCVKDINENITEVICDDLGLVIAAAVMGKGSEADSLSELKAQLADRPQQQLIIKQFFNGAEDSDAAWLLQDASNRYLYNFDNLPVSSAGISRERHVQDLLQNGGVLKLQYSFQYMNGAGSIVAQKQRARAGNAWVINQQNERVEVAADPRWLGNGRTVLNNKGKPVRKYEPYFSATHLYEPDKVLTEIGVSAVALYDSAGRLIRTDFPNGSYSTVQFDAWMHRIFDQNDTVKDSSWYSNRIALPADDAERVCAVRSELHDQTPTLLFLDSLGSIICSIGHNRWKDINGNVHEEFPVTFAQLDIEGNIKTVIDPKGNPVMQYKYDMLGRTLYQSGTDCGECWLLPDITGKPLYTWDSLEQSIQHVFDIIHRPVGERLSISGSPWQTVNMLVYGDNVPNAAAKNLRGKTWKAYDQSGLTTSETYDFAGNVVSGSRQFTVQYDQTIYWPDQDPDSLLDPEVFHIKGSYDALNRPQCLYSPDTPEIPASELYPLFDEAGKLKQVDARLRGSQTVKTFVQDILYNEKGQRLSIIYGNGVKSAYSYETDTLRLKRLLTTRNSGATILQDINYTYDPMGNPSRITDDAQPANYFNNTVVNPQNDYEYDALYQLVRASGREHIGQNQPSNEWDNQRSGKILPGDGQAMQRYEQRFEYDVAGNLLKILHHAGNGNPQSNQWTREFVYDASNNRLLNTSVGNQAENYSYNAHGSMISMPHLQEMDWDFCERLRHIQQGTVHAYYAYDAGGERVRKVVVKQGGLVEIRLYLGGFELFRRFSNQVKILERETLHIMDDKSRIAMVETCTLGNDLIPQLIRYQYSNQHGSACLETDDSGAIISYEEYHPYGTTSWQAGRSLAEVQLKRYRYSGMERDEESGLNYHSARYYATWLGRWTAADPSGLADGSNVYAFVSGNPVGKVDTSGKEGMSAADKRKLIMGVAGMRATMLPWDFHRFLSKNESAIFYVMSPYGYKGSRVKAEDALADFDKAFSNWLKGKPTVSGPEVRPVEPESKAAKERRMWAAAAGDPIAAVVIVTGHLISETIGKKLGFEQDPDKATAAGQGISHLVTAGGSLNAPHPVNELVRQQPPAKDQTVNTLDPNRVTAKPVARPAVPAPKKAAPAPAAPTPAAAGLISDSFSHSPVILVGQKSERVDPAKEPDVYNRYQFTLKTGLEQSFTTYTKSTPALRRGDPKKPGEVAIGDVRKGDPYVHIEHTHPPGSLPLFSFGDFRFMLDQNNDYKFKSSTTFSVIAERWPNANNYLRSEGLEPSPDLTRVTIEKRQIDPHGVHFPNLQFSY